MPVHRSKWWLIPEKRILKAKTHCSVDPYSERGGEGAGRRLVHGVFRAMLCFTYLVLEQPFASLSQKAIFLRALKLPCGSFQTRQTLQLLFSSIADLDREYRLRLLPLHSTLPGVYCSPEFEGPQMLTHWHVVLIIPVILLHLKQCVWWMTLAELLLPRHVVFAWKG